MRCFGALLTRYPGFGAGTGVPGVSQSGAHVYHNRWLESLTDPLRPGARQTCLDQPRIIYGVVIFGIVSTVVVLLGATVGREFLPDLDEGALWLQVQIAERVWRLNKASDMASDLQPQDSQIPGGVLCW